MPGIDKLPIEEALEDSPQNELSAATHLTSKLLKEYEKQRFPLGGDDEVMNSTLQQFAKVIDELSSCHAVLSTQLADAMMFPITQFKERDLKEILTLKEVFQISSNDHDAAITRYSRLSKKRENEKGGNLMSQGRGEVAGGLVMDIDNCSVMAVDCEDRRYCFQITSFDGKKSSILQAESKKDYEEINFFKMGSENLSEQLEEFLTNIGTSVQDVRREMDREVETMQQTIEDLEIASDPLYLPDPDTTKFLVQRNLTRKAGYLNAR
ncbi:DCC-interacting protein 13-alpha-like, partial [Protobothrops mucrosquamatus]|uniref:DCC-interacting protein 13-alpha-like n=1 Tax=Protobothrops mucrosquamatus TaxID=103944 RepID=UPI0010FAD7F4